MNQTTSIETTLGVKPTITKKFLGLVSTGKLEDTTRVLLNIIFSRDSVEECDDLYHLSTEDRRNLYLLWDFLDSVNRDCRKDYSK